MKTTTFRGWLLTALLLAAAGFAPDAEAQRSYWNSGNDGGASGERGGESRRAERCGGAISLERVLHRVRRRYPGRLLDADMRCAQGGPVYILKMRSADNRIRVIRADATNGRILSASRR